MKSPAKYPSEGLISLLANGLDDLNYGILITEASPLTEPGPKIVYVNAAIEKLTGYSRKELLGNQPRIFQGPETDREVLAEIHQALENLQPIRRELLNYTKSREKYWIELDINPLQDESDQVTHFIAIQRDITHRKNAESEFADSVQMNTMLRDALNQHCIVAITNTHGEITYANEKFCQISGYHQEELIGKNPRSLNSGYHPESFFADLWQTVSEGKVWQNDIRNKNKSGEYYWVHATIFPLLDSQQKPTSFLAIQTEITRRKKAEQQALFQASLLDEAHNAIFVTDVDDVITYWNPAAERIFGWSAEEACGKKSTQLLSTREEDSEVIRQAILKNQGWSNELHYQTKDQKTVIAETRWTMVKGDDGKPIAFLSINSDITEKKTIEAQFYRAQRIESVGRLAGGIAHDLNNVLAPIMITAANLKFEQDPKERAHMLEVIEASALRATSLVKQVLYFSKGVSGERKQIDLKEVIDELVSIIKETFPKNITLAQTIPDDVWFIQGDVTQIHQVLMNMCVNARDAMDAGGQLTIELKNVVLDEMTTTLNWKAEAGAYVVISITDEGSGIPTTEIQTIFDPFYTTKDTGKGAGIGLSTSLSIVKSHHGFINVYSEEQKGTTFKIYFPADASDSEQKQVEIVDSRFPVGNGECVLIVDDESSIRHAAQKMMQRFGYQTMEAENGAAAAAVYAKHQDDIDVVLTDMSMPIMDGHALILSLKAINPEVIIIASSGLTSNASLSRAIGAGVKHFLPKPYTCESLLNRLAEALKSTPEAPESK